MTEHPQTPSSRGEEHTASATPGESPSDPTASSGPGPAEPSGWAHPLQLAHLVMGVAFACLVGLWALITTDVVTGADVRWLLPVPWLVAGAAGLVAWVVAQRRS